MLHLLIRSSTSCGKALEQAGSVFLLLCPLLPDVTQRYCPLYFPKSLSHLPVPPCRHPFKPFPAFSAPQTVTPCNPNPIQRPHPTIMVGGSGEKYLLKVVAKHANRYNIFFGTPQEMKRKITIVKDYCSKIGRDHKEIQYSVVLPCIITESGEDIKQVAARYKRRDKTVDQYLDFVAGVLR